MRLSAKSPEAALGGGSRPEGRGVWIGPRNPRTLLLAVPLLWVAVLGSAAAAVYCKHRARQLFVQLEALDARRDNLDIEWGQLQLEQSAWSTHAFVENVARTRLHMTTPLPQDIRLVTP